MITFVVISGEKGGERVISIANKQIHFICEPETAYLVQVRTVEIVSMEMDQFKLK